MHAPLIWVDEPEVRQTRAQCIHDTKQGLGLARARVELGLDLGIGLGLGLGID